MIIPAESRFKTQPYKHQMNCLSQFGRKKSFALLAEPGTGKTWIMINNFADLWSSDDCDTVLVLAPNGVHTNWTRIELPKHMPDWCRYRAAAWTADPNRREQAELEHLFKDPGAGELRILTMNWEALQNQKGFKFAEKFGYIGRRFMIVCDESDAAKNPAAIRVKRLMDLKKYSYWRRIMTGTPINNAPFDAFAQFSFLDETILGTTSYFAFKAEYAEMMPQQSNLMKHLREQKGRNTRYTQIVLKDREGRPRYRNLDKLSRLIAPHSFRVLKKDCLDLPQKIYKTLVFRMTKQQIDVYLKAENECRLVFENQESAFNKLVAVTKLSQITSGYFMHPASEEPVRIPGANPKLDMMTERVAKLVEDGEKVIVWARYRVEIADIVARLTALGIKVVEYHGGVAKGGRITAIDSFEQGDAQVFVGNQQAGGTGITLVAAHNVFYFSNDFSMRNRVQSEDRAHRIGQRFDVNYYNLVGKGTIDEEVVRSLDNKQDVAATILDKGLGLFGQSF